MVDGSGDIGRFNDAAEMGMSPFDGGGEMPWTPGRSAASKGRDSEPGLATEWQMAQPLAAILWPVQSYVMRIRAASDRARFPAPPRSPFLVPGGPRFGPLNPQRQ